jgi:dCMP deaminase
MRPDKDEYYLIMAAAASLRSTCARRKVGCVLVDDNNRIMATGYNGPARGAAHCIDYPCAGAHLPTGMGLDLCEAIHAEVNAIAYCRDVYKIKTCYCTTSPCVSCTKMLLGTSCSRIVFLDEYAHSPAQLLWTNSTLDPGGKRREWVHRSSAAADCVRNVSLKMNF